mmetsp:Transcript_19318/g.44019  ORF Transcript_19318/g.44019 Transcript_19318/m.44019 type:complete len:87 (+) Transcript_19318:115-375(+)
MLSHFLLNVSYEVNIYFLDNILFARLLSLSLQSVTIHCVPMSFKFRFFQEKINLLLQRSVRRSEGNKSHERFSTISERNNFFKNKN